MNDPKISNRFDETLDKFSLRKMSWSMLFRGGLSGLPFGIFGAFLITDSFFSRTLIIFSLFVVGCIAGSVSGIALSVVGGFAASGVIVFGLDHLLGDTYFPLWSVALVSILLIVAVSLAVRVFDQVKKLTVSRYLLELGALTTSFLLVYRWPLKTPLDHLAFASYEDNAAWIATVANFRNGHYSAGLGGYVLDPLMATLHFLISFGTNGVAQNPETAFITTGTTYAAVEFLAILMVGLALVKFTIRNEKHDLLLFVATPGAIAITYSAIQIPQSTGHLTFIGALMYIWSIGVLGNDTIEPFSRRGYSVFFLCSLLLIGTTGMWWPSLIVTPLSAILAIFLVLPIDELRSRLALSGKAQKQLIIAAAMSIGVLSLVSIPILRNFQSLSVREFFSVKGGLHIASNNNLVIGSIALFTLVVFLQTSQKGRPFPRTPSDVFTTNISLIGVLAVLLYFASVFIGPEFTQNYSVQKMTLLFALSCIPLIVMAVVKGVERVDKKLASFAVVPFIFFIGSLTVGWNVNTPRELKPPSWGAALISIANGNPDTLILCSTSDPSRNLEAYLCTRHAAALQPAFGESATDWRHLQLFPSNSIPEDEERILRLKSALESKAAQKNGVVILSLEKDFIVAEEDVWWMSQLPLSKMTSIGLEE